MIVIVEVCVKCHLGMIQEMCKVGKKVFVVKI